MQGRIRIISSMVFCVVFFFAGAASASDYAAGRVFDYSTLKPIEGAIVTGNNEVVRTDGSGMFVLKNPSPTIGVRACGYARGEQRLPFPPVRRQVNVYLLPFTPKALYLTSYGIGDRKLRESAIGLLKESKKILRGL